MKPVKETFNVGCFLWFFFSNPSSKCWPSTSPSVKLLPLSCVWAFCVLVPGPVEPQLQAHGFFPKCCCERSWCNAGVDPAGIDIPGMFSHPPAGFKKSWSRLIIAGSVSGKGSLAGRESSSRDRPGLSHIWVSLNFLGLSWAGPGVGLWWSLWVRIFHDSVTQHLPFGNTAGVLPLPLPSRGENPEIELWGWVWLWDISGVCSPVWRRWKHCFVLKKACSGCDPAHSGHCWWPEELSGLMFPEQDQPQLWGDSAPSSLRFTVNQLMRSGIPGALSCSFPGSWSPLGPGSLIPRPYPCPTALGTAVSPPSTWQWHGSSASEVFAPEISLQEGLFEVYSRQ